MSEKIFQSKDYRLFELMDFNREVVKINNLEESMTKHGWISAYPMHVVRNGNGKFKIKAGHHRFCVAEKLNIPVKYVICNDASTIHELEAATVRWSLLDYLISFCRMGKEDYLKVKEYCDTTGIGISDAISMLSGQTAASGNSNSKFKNGTYKISSSSHAWIVADIVLHCKKCGIPWAHNTLFVRALSKIAWAEGFDPAVLKYKISSMPSLVEKQPNMQSYMDLIDSLYNRHSKIKVPLRFNAEKAARERSVC